MNHTSHPSSSQPRTSSPTPPEDAVFLGTPIGDHNSVDASIITKCNDLRVMGDRLPHFQRHDSLLLLRHAFSIPKILYLLRTSPCFRSPELPKFDQLLQSITCAVLNVNLSDDRVWTQASLPVSLGGIGVRRAVQLAPSAFLASAAGCLMLSKEILPLRMHNSPSPDTMDALALWKSTTSEPPPTSPSDIAQKAYDPDMRTRARLLGASSKESGAWLNAPPVSSLGLRLDNDTITIAVSLRLGVALCHPHPCKQCGSPVDEFALHGLSGVRSQGRHSCHNELNDIIHRSLSSAGIPSQKEPRGLSRLDGKRPDGVTMLPWNSGCPLVWDATCSDTFAPSHLSLASRKCGAVADQAEVIKASQYRHLDTTHTFAPVSVEAIGAFGQETLYFLKEVDCHLRTLSGEAQSHQHLIQRLSIAIQRGNALSIRGSLCSLSDIDDID